MIKRTAAFGIFFIMLLAFSGCDIFRGVCFECTGNPCVCVQAEALAEYKAAAKAGLDAFATDKGQENYSADNWAAILVLVADGKTAVDAATDKPQVNLAAAEAKQAINAVLPKKEDYVYQEGDFVLTITVDRETVIHGQKITANAVLKNNSNQSQDITIRFRLIGWHIDGWNYSIDESMPLEPFNMILEKGDTHIGSEIYGYKGTE